MFDNTPINEELVRSLHAGSFMPGRRNVVLVGGAGTGKTHPASAIATNVICAGARGRYFNTVDLVTQLEEKPLIGKAVRSRPICAARSSWCLMSSAICRSLAQAASCYST